MTIFADRVKETSFSSGTGSFSLNGAVTGYQSFNSAFGTGSSNFSYAIIAVDASNVPTGDWEVGSGYLSGPTTLQRSSVTANSLGTTALINFQLGGTKILFADLAAADVTNMLTKAGGTMTGLLTLSGDPTAALGAATKQYVDAVTPSLELYVQSRGTNLITNGSGLMGSNYNFSSFTYNQLDVAVGAGSFLSSASSKVYYNDEYIPVDPHGSYTLNAWAKSGDPNGSNYYASNSQYLGVALFDIDKLSIDPAYVMKWSGSTDTTLASALNPGNTTVSLTSATGWYAGGSGTPFAAQFTWWPYTNSKGYSYPNYTYSRNYSGAYYGSGGSGPAWSSISSNTLNLVSAWTGPTLPAGTPIRNTYEGASYKYIAMNAVAVPNTWTKYSGTISGLDTTGSNSSTNFEYGTAYAKLLFLINYQTGGTTNNIRYSGLTFA